MSLRERALAVTPGGAQTRSKRATAFPVGFPQFLVAAEGAHVWDPEGNKYVDWICALGAIGLGHRHADVDNAVRDQLAKGVSFSLATPMEIVVAEKLSAMLPGADMVRFCKTGSEATEGAMRIARLATGRDRIISIGYHGWHTLHDAAATDHWGHPAATPGVPTVFREYVRAHPWGLPLPEGRHPDIAAVLVEPMRDTEPPGGYLGQLREWCDFNGSLLILDEMVTGFRWAIGGAGEHFGVTPDLGCYGKAMANGYPLAAIVGRGDHMQHASYVSGTFGGECLSLAACRAALEVYRREPVIKHMWSVGSALMQGFNVLAKPHGLEMQGYPVHPRIVGDTKMEFIALAAKYGVLFHPAGFNVSYAHRMAEVSETLIACRRALEAMA